MANPDPNRPYRPQRPTPSRRLIRWTAFLASLAGLLRHLWQWHRGL